MNKQQKIIVSIVGITIVLLALLGITYAYYLTRIEGNTNINSISITTANLKLSYGDGNEIITASNIIPNTVVSEKTFTVTNTGNSTIENYRVVLELASIEGVVPSVFKYPKDFQITLTCISKNITTNEVSGRCDGYNGYWDNESFEIQKNTIAEGIRHEYSLTIKYVDSGIDQSDDMGKNLNLKVQIYGDKDTSTLNGTITGVDSTYVMKLNSKPKASTLKPTSNSGEYRYSFIGVEPGEHTLSLVNKDGEVVSTEKITINKGTTSNINGSTIIVSDNQSTIHLTTSSSGTSLSSTATFNPYDSNTNSLAYHIINNARNTTIADNELGSAMYRENPDTLVAGDIAVYRESSTLNISNWNLYDTWNDAESYGPTSGVNASSCTEDMIGKYFFSMNYDAGEYGPIESCDNGKIVVKKLTDKYESSLSIAQDDFGISYYYRGNVKNNYVNFAGMCWRIVRILGDGSTRLILEDQNEQCNDIEGNDLNNNSTYFSGNWNIGTGNYGYEETNIDSDSNNEFIMKYLKPVTNKTSSMVKAFYEFQTTKLSDYTSKLKSGDWCLGDKAYTRNGSSNPYTYTPLEEYNYSIGMYYDANIRLRNENVNGNQPSLKCNGTRLNEFASVTEVSTNVPMYVNALTADEMVYAGGKYDKSNLNYYLINNYQKTSYKDFWSISPNYYGSGYSDTAYFMENTGKVSILAAGYVNDSGISFRPTITLESNIGITGGNGLQSSPYVID